MKFPIEAKLKEADEANERENSLWEQGRSPKHRFLVDKSFEESREWWSLGNFARLYNAKAEIRLWFAEKQNPPNPDFAVFDASGTLCGHIEVTEWIEPHRRRDAEYSRPFDAEARFVSPSELADPLLRLQEQISNKLQKQSSYPLGTSLLVVDNVGLGPYPWCSRQYGDVEAAQRLVQQCQTSFTSITQVWLLRETTRPMTVHLLLDVETAQEVCALRRSCRPSSRQTG